MVGIYIHIPFCKSKCSYCDFYSIANKSKLNRFVENLRREIKLRKSIFNGKTVETIYFGGGTPSILTVKQIQSIIEDIFMHYEVSNNAEITLEANPDDLSKDYLKSLKEGYVNRLSIGIQSLDDNILKLMRRRHTSKEAIDVVESAANLGFSNISVDLIYGIDGLEKKLWEETIEQTLSLPVQHLSAYHLGIEEGTLLHRMLREGRHKKMNEKNSYEQYEILIDVAKKFGVLQYEISNFAKSGFVSKHNSGYWNGLEYIGFGPSAHSYYNNKRFYNFSNLDEYCMLIENNENTFDFEDIGFEERINERIMLHLRTTNGLDISNFKKEFGESAADRLLKKTLSLNPEHYNINKNNLSLTRSGMFISDSIIVDLIE